MLDSLLKHDTHLLSGPWLKASSAAGSPCSSPRPETTCSPHSSARERAAGSQALSCTQLPQRRHQLRQILCTLDEAGLAWEPFVQESTQLEDQVPWRSQQHQVPCRDDWQRLSKATQGHRQLHALLRPRLSGHVPTFRSRAVSALVGHCRSRRDPGHTWEGTARQAVTWWMLQSVNRQLEKGTKQTSKQHLDYLNART